MKRILFIGLAACLAYSGSAQEEKKAETDTVRIGEMIIIRKGGKSDPEVTYEDHHTKIYHRKGHPENITTNWGIFDIGFSAYNDKTVYGPGTEADQFAPGSNKDWFQLNSGKSRSINIWFFMQRLNMIQHVVNLKYGLGLELNNYFYDDERVHFLKNPTSVILDDDYQGAKKNKLAADYITVPMMINFNFTPDKRNGFGLSAGISAGYLYNSRQKVKIGSDKQKIHNNFDLERWKISYVGELLLGPVKFYASYALSSMFDKGLDQVPYNVGLRLSNW